jgi:hypothetical protein
MRMQSPPLIAKENLPGLQRPTLPRHHVDRNRGLRDIDAQFEQLTVDLGSAARTSTVRPAARASTL